MKVIEFRSDMSLIESIEQCLCAATMIVIVRRNIEASEQGRHNANQKTKIESLTTQRDRIFKILRDNDIYSQSAFSFPSWEYSS